jgi:hypothetical protein
MAVELFGFRIGRADDEAKQAIEVPSFAPPINDDGATEVVSNHVYGTALDFEGTAKSEAELVTKYREMSLQPECDMAVDDIVNEAIVVDDRKDPVSLVLDDVDASASIKKRMHQEFAHLLTILDFNNKAYDIFRNFYVDGRLYYHIMIDPQNPRAGVLDLRYIDPRKIRKIREERKGDETKDARKKGIHPGYNEYYMYSPKGIMSGAQSAVKISKDSICHITSGLMDNRNHMTLSHMHKAIKPLNQLRMLEDATVIYRLSRAPERRIFYIDVGNLPKMKAEQYVRDMMTRHKNKLVYDASTGEVRDDRKFMTMLEDFWLPRREGGRGTEITTLPGGQNLGEMDDVDYFRKKLYKALNVPASRIEQDNAFNLGRASEITRDELKFSKFVNRLRSRFSMLFDDLLEIHLVLQGVMTREEFKKIKHHIRYDYVEDNHFSELKETEILTGRLTLLREIDEYTGKYFSQRWVRSNILRMSESEMENMDDQIAKENEEQGTGEDQLADLGADQQEDFEPEVEAYYANTEPSAEEKELVESMSKLLDDVDIDDLFEELDDERD